MIKRVSRVSVPARFAQRDLILRPISFPGDVRIMPHISILAFPFPADALSLHAHTHTQSKPVSEYEIKISKYPFAIATTHTRLALPDMDLNLPTSVVLLARLLAALTPSYIHPDEHFQGPQVIAAQVFGWDVHKTWEFTADRPIRSPASLWTVYAPVMYLWRYILGTNASALPLYFALRLWFLLLTYLFGATHLATHAHPTAHPFVHL